MPIKREVLTFKKDVGVKLVQGIRPHVKRDDTPGRGTPNIAPRATIAVHIPGRKEALGVGLDPRFECKQGISIARRTRGRGNRNLQLRRHSQEDE